MKVREIFESIQGEGARAGTLNIFIRLSGCNKSCLFCDTNWSTSKDMTLIEIVQQIEVMSATEIIWTGGEPTLQLTEGIVQYFKNLGYYQAIETNGTNPIPKNIQYVACSPKVHPTEIMPSYVDEFRYACGVSDPPPLISDLPYAKDYFLSPIFTGKNNLELNITNVEFCLNEIRKNPQWKLSIQTHKLLGIR